MQIVEEHFEDGTFRYDQIERQGMKALYSQTHKTSGIQRYETVILRVKKAGIAPGGYDIPEREAYPTSREWGLYGWTFYTLSEARRDYERLVSQTMSLEEQGTEL